MSLAEFILARLKDDEDAYELHRDDCRLAGYGTASGWCDCDGPTRWKAEIAAKRRIVGMHTPTGTTSKEWWHHEDKPLSPECDNPHRNGLPNDNEPYCGGHVAELPACPACKDSIDPSRIVTNWDVAEEIIDPCDVLRLLALPYAAHPDYPLNDGQMTATATD